MYSSIKENFVVWVLKINLAIIFIGGALIIYLYFFQGSNPVELESNVVKTVEPFRNEEGKVIPKHTFYTGELLTYEFNFCKNVKVPAKMYGAYYDTVKIDMPMVEVNSEKGCQERIASYYKIPAILPSAKYHFEVRLVYQVNPLREVTVTYKTEDFNIINNK